MTTASDLTALATLLNDKFRTNAFSTDGVTMSLQAAPLGVTPTVDGFTVDLAGFSTAAPLEAPLLDGFGLRVAAFHVVVGGGAISAFSGDAAMEMPFFGAGSAHLERFDVGFTVADGGQPGLALAPQHDPRLQDSQGKPKLSWDMGFDRDGGHYPVALSLSMNQLSTVDLDGKLWISVDGDLTLDVGGGSGGGDGKRTDATISLPKLSFKDLHVAADGTIGSDHTWLDLGDHVGVDYAAFKLHLKKIGFGNDLVGDTQQRWIGFDADIHIGAGLGAGGAARGFRINIDSGAISLQGMDVEFTIPQVIEVKGKVDHLHAEDQSEYDASESKIALPRGKADLFPLDIVKGELDLKLLIPGLGWGIAAQMLAGHIASTELFALDLKVDFGNGIPLFPGINLKQVEGLFATGLRPDPLAMNPPHTWWEWYRWPSQDDGTIIVGNDIGPASSKDSTSKEGQGDDDPTEGSYTATDLQKWLFPKDGGLGFGLGAVIGTADGGWTVSAGVVILLLFPGPVIMVTGKADILKGPIKDPRQEGHFNAMALFDGSAGIFDLVLDVHYKVPKVIDIHGTAELFVSASKGWFFALGKPPHDQRVTARIVELFEVSSYLIVSDDGLIAGCWAGWGRSWNFGPLEVRIAAHIAVLAAVQWAPFQIGGGINIGGEARLSAFGIGVSISVDALLEACAPHPWWVHGELDVSLDLPWPLPDVSASIALSWGGDDGTVAPAPLALSTITALLGDHNGVAAVAPDAGDPVQATPDHYPLLAHAGGGPPGDVYLSVEDPTHPGIIDAAGSDAAELTRRHADWRTVMPPDDLGPLSPSTGPVVTLLPQDSHLVLGFARPVHDDLNLPGAQNGAIPPAVVQAKPAVILPSDDMSNLNPNPPAPRYEYESHLRQVTIYEHRSDGWHAVASAPKLSEGGDIQGEWRPPTDPPAGTKPQPNVTLTLWPVITGTDGDRLPVLPTGPALYAVKVVTEISARHAGSSDALVPVAGSPVVEFAFFQTATGPGLVPNPDNPGQAAPVPNPVPTPAFPAPSVPKVFPRGGVLTGLDSYVQWSAPMDAEQFAYSAYDINVEFDECYVHELYGACAGSTTQRLHLRCRDRNGRHTLPETIAVHVPSAPLQSAVVGVSIVREAPRGMVALVQQPAMVSPSHPVEELRSLVLHHVADGANVAQVPGGVGAAAVPPDMAMTGTTLHLNGPELATLGALVADAGMRVDTSSSRVFVTPSQLDRLRRLLEDESYKAKLQAIWPQPLRPGNRYAVDVVGGPLMDQRRDYQLSRASSLVGTPASRYSALSGEPGPNQLQYEAVRAFLDHEDSLTSLHHFEFQSSRYRSFAAHVANAVAISDNPAAEMRRYVVDVEPQAWLADATHDAGGRTAARQAYLTARTDLATFAGSYDATSPRGQRELRTRRVQVGKAWDQFAEAMASAFDPLVGDLGYPELSSARVVPPPPATELAALVDAADHIVGLLLTSPEPFAWRRLWQWTTLEVAPATHTLPLQGVTVVWCSDGTRALVVPVGRVGGSYSLRMNFQDNVGAEMPCLTRDGRAASDVVDFGALFFAPVPHRRPVHHHPVHASPGIPPGPARVVPPRPGPPPGLFG